MHRDADGAGLIGNRARDGLPDPPGGIGGEFVAAAILEFIHGLHQADIAFLDQVEELQAAIGVFLGDGDHQAKIGFHHLLLRHAGFALALAHLLVDALELGHRQADLGRHDGDIVADRLDAGAGILGKLDPALVALELAHLAEPLRIKLVILVLLEEFLTRNLVALGQPQQAAFQHHQLLVVAVEAFHQAFDAVVVEMHRFHQPHHLMLQLGVGLVLLGIGIGMHQGGLQALFLGLLQLLVMLGDGVKGFQHLRLELRFHGGERQVGLVVLVHFLGPGNHAIGQHGAWRHGHGSRLGAVALHHDALDRAARLRRLGLGRGLELGLHLRLHRGRCSGFLVFFLQRRIRPGTAAHGGFQIHHIAQQQAAFHQFVAPMHNRLDGQRAFADRADHLLAAGLDALGDGDFALA